MHDVLSITARLQEAPTMIKRVESNFNDTFAASFAHHSHALSVAAFNNHDVLNLLIKGKPAQAIDGLQAIDLIAHRDAVQYALSAAKANDPLNVETIKRMHAQIMLQDPFTGWFRSPEITVGNDGKMIFHSRERTLEQYLDEHEARVGAGEDPLRCSADFHLRFIALQPFLSANARIARLILLVHMVRSGYPPFSLPSREKDRYIRILQKGDLDALVLLIEQALEAAIRLRIAVSNKATKQGGYVGLGDSDESYDDMIDEFIS